MEHDEWPISWDTRPDPVSTTGPFLTSYKALLLLGIDTYCRHGYIHRTPEVAATTLFDLISALSNPAPRPFATVCAEWDRIIFPDLDGDDEDDLEPPAESFTFWGAVHMRLERVQTIDNFEQFLHEAWSLVHPNDEEAVVTPEAETGEQLDVQDSSPFGLFVRRCWLAYQQLEFHEARAFFRGFQCYLGEKSTTAPPQRTHDAKERPPAGMVSRFDVESQVDRYIEPDYPSTDLALGTISRTELQDEFLLFQRLYPDLPKVQYAQYLAHTLAGRYEPALNCLHRFFDHTGTALLHDSSAAHPAAPPYHYALLSLASLQLRFGRLSEAARMIQEAIETAQRQRDQVCLSYASTWYYQIMAALPSMATTNSSSAASPDRIRVPADQRTTRAQMLESLSRKTRLLDLVHLRFLSELSRAKQSLVSGEPPRRVLEALVAAESLTRHYLLPEALGRYYTLAASVWETYGVPALAVLYTQLRIAYVPVTTTAMFANPGDDSAILGYCHLARYLGDIHNEADLTDAQTAPLAGLDRLVVNQFVQVPHALDRWRGCRSDLNLQRLVHRREPLGATEQSLVNQIMNRRGPERSPSSSLKAAWLHLKRGHYSLALEQALAVHSGDLCTQADPLALVVAYRLTAEVYLATDAGPLALLYIERARRLACEANFNVEAARCTVVLVEIVMKMGQPDRALRITMTHTQE
ncbi:APC5 protein, partial [Tieghemiomyces parasiticus]